MAENQLESSDWDSILLILEKKKEYFSWEIEQKSLPLSS